ncbi:mitochondrial import receptor subunit TOM70 isoform X1 [Prorops nasuta]|uniref:mitochondrial import receptor subunit TOM70 isoform X1 n=1 Tax=Prorops nasuta TaxID=863751 RepID=UPI0034CF897E
MSTLNGSNSIAGNSLPKWQVALFVGAPIAFGLGYIYYKNNTKPSSKPSRGKNKNSVEENGTARNQQISIDEECNLSNSNVLKEVPLMKAQKCKNLGNSHFRIGKYDEAIAEYNNAIDACPKENKEELATFYQNRAAAYEHLRKYNSVKEDCTKALELKPKYAKALLRRARALEQTNELESALEDVTVACILEGFQNHTALIMADRVLKHLGKQHAQEHLAKKKFIMPSKHFIQTYKTSFNEDPVFILVDKPLESIHHLLQNAIIALKEQNFDDIILICTQQLKEIEDEKDEYYMDLILLRATFSLLLGKHEDAFTDFETIITSRSASVKTKVNALIKRATLYMQMESVEKCYNDFTAAERLNPKCTDIYHHRGQVNLLLEKIIEAKADFEKAIMLNPNYGVIYVQKCYADYRYAIMQKEMDLLSASMKKFEEACQKFPDCSECYVLYAQLLSETQDYQKADIYFAKAIEKDPKNATIYVHRGLLQLQWNANMVKAIEYIKTALELDDKCEFGYETLGTIEVQRGNLKEAIELFDKALALGRTSMELTHIFSLRDAAKSQLSIKEKLGPDFILNL